MLMSNGLRPSGAWDTAWFTHLKKAKAWPNFAARKNRPENDAKKAPAPWPQKQAGKAGVFCLPR